MVGNGRGALVLPSKVNTYDQSIQIDMTSGQISGIIMNAAHKPSNLSAAEAIKVEAGGQSFASERHPSPKLRHGLTSRYQYPPLDDESDYIRILEIIPGERDEPIRARLKPCSLGNPPSYEAMSYAWGSKNDNAVVIICEGSFEYTVEVPKNLHAALKQLRHHSDCRSIWADAICINQSDDTHGEKNHQVRLMRKIYQRATMVLIWLGHGDDISCGAHFLFKTINQMSQRNPALPPPEDRETWTALVRFFKRPWFSRVWCLQEAILAPSATVMLGEHSTSWEHVGLAATAISRAPAQTLFDNGVSYSIYNARVMHWLSHTNNRRGIPSFLGLLAGTRAFKASDCRDKIYGILGIPTTDSDPDAGKPFLQPDYTKTLSEVYIKCALVIMQKTRSLLLLSYVHHAQLPRRAIDVSEQIEADKTLVEVPSWVPRWHEYLTSTVLANAFEAPASMSLKPVLKTEVRGLELITHGARVTTVKTVSRIFDNSITSPHAAPETANEIWVEAFEHLKASTTEPTEALYTLSTLLTEGLGRGESIVQDREQHFADFLAFMYNPAVLSDGEVERGGDPAQEGSTRGSRTDGTQLGRPNMLVDSLFRPRTDLALPPVSKPGRENYFQKTMRRVCTRRRLVLTEDGHVGLGPEVTEPGDVVCILGDASVPLLLRPEADGDGFRLVGEAYIHGMMFGEIKISEMEQIVLSDQPFVSLDEVRARDEKLQAQRDQSD